MACLIACSGPTARRPHSAPREVKADSAQEEVETDPAVYDVYRAVFEHLIGRPGPKVVVSARTHWPSEMLERLKRTHPDSEGWLCGRIQGLSRSTAAAFLRSERVRQEAKLVVDRFGDLPVTLADVDRDRRSLSHLRERFPDLSGFVEFSRVAFAGGGAEALVYVVHTAGDLNAEGRVVWLKRSDDGWVVHGSANLWVA